jgi:ATP-dependent Clp protease ATP-binding subunit ClpC
VFERFTERARQVVVLASDEARLLRHNYIGTEHILLGLLREEEGLAARVLDSFDLTLEEVRAQVARIVGEGDEFSTGQIPFTPRAKNVLELSLREALELGHNYIGTEHVLLGLVRENGGVGARILQDFENPEAVRKEVVRTLSGGARSRTSPGPVTPAGYYEPQSPPFAEEVISELNRVISEKEAAIEADQFERAATLRDRERRLRTTARRFERAWRDEPDPIDMPPPMRTAPSFRDPWSWRPVLALGWALFGTALGIGVGVGWLIWG